MKIRKELAIMSRHNNEKKKMPAGLITAIVIILIIAVGVSVYFIGFHNPKPTDNPADTPKTEEPAKTPETDEEVPDKEPVDSVKDGNDVGDQNEHGGDDSDPGTIKDVTNE
ncbi:MAG: hypothetical protein RSE61_06130 [Anaerovoracaceae bacterium]